MTVRNAESLAEGIRSLVDDDARRQSMGARARERALAEFDVRRVERLSLEIYASR